MSSFWSAARRWSCHPLPALLARIYLSGIFLYASVYKIGYTAEFAESIASYQIVPHYLVNPMAVALPWVELLAGTMLLAGVRTRAAALILAGLMVVFTVAVAATLIRGVPIGCGCFKSIEEPISWKTLVRDLFWLGLALHVWKCDRWLRLENLLLPPTRDEAAPSFPEHAEAGLAGPPREGTA